MTGILYMVSSFICGPIAPIFWIMYWVKIVGYKNQLKKDKTGVSSDEEDDRPQRARRRGDDDEERPRRSRSRRDEDEGDRPRRRRRDEDDDNDRDR